VRNAVSRVTPDGQVKTVQSFGKVMPVDLSVSNDGRWIAVAHAGPADDGAPRPFIEFDEQDGFASDSEPRAVSGGGFGFDGNSNLSLLPADMVELDAVEGDCGGAVFPMPLPMGQEPVVAVAWNPTRAELVVQTRDPASIVIISDPVGESVGATARTLPLTPNLQHTGYELFNRDSGGGLACASCHPEGSEDGHVWHFTGLGARRTQALNIGLEGTAPFHWDGTLPNLGSIMSEVFVGRMGGVHQSPERLDALQGWVFSVPEPAPLVVHDAAAADRGQALFESADVGCATCHSGEKLTDNRSYVVGTNGDVPLQVPSLVGVAQRLPLMHDGCAQTLRDRFTAPCGGGDAHGHTSQLDAPQIDDLVAYLESL
jgi:hypothetical protein